MGIKIASIAIKEKNYDESKVLGFELNEFRRLLELEFDDEVMMGINLEFESFLTTNGWYIVIFRYFPYFVYELLSKLSANTELVVFSVTETSMESSVEYWNEGKEVWSVHYDEEFQTKGLLPSFYETVSMPILKKQEKAENIDYLIEIPSLLATEIVGFNTYKWKFSDGNSMIETSYRDYKIPLSELVENLELQSNEVVYYFDKAKNKFVFVMNEYELEENESLKNEIENNYENFIPLPSVDEINEYEIMKEFSNNQTKEVKESLLNTLNGKSIFRKFKDKIFELNIRDKWFAFKKKELEYIAEDWIEEHHLECRFKS